GAKEEDCLDVGPGAVLGQQEDDMGAEAEFGVGVLAVDRQQVVALSGGQGEHLRVSFIRRVWSGTVLSPDYTGPVTFPLVGNHLDIHEGFDACDQERFPSDGAFDFIWAHPPYWRQKL